MWHGLLAGWSHGCSLTGEVASPAGNSKPSSNHNLIKQFKQTNKKEIKERENQFRETHKEEIGAKTGEKIVVMVY